MCYIYFRPAAIFTRTLRLLISKDWWVCTRWTSIIPNWNNCCLTATHRPICRRISTLGNTGRIALPLEKSGIKARAGLVGYNYVLLKFINYLKFEFAPLVNFFTFSSIFTGFWSCRSYVWPCLHSFKRHEKFPFFGWEFSFLLLDLWFWMQWWLPRSGMELLEK